MKLRSHSKKSNSQKSQSPKNSKSTSTDHENLLPLLAENLKNYRPPRKCRIKNHLASFDKFIESRNCANYPSINRGVQQTNFDRYLRRIRERLLLDGQMGPYQSLTALDLREHAERVSNGFNILTSLQVLTSKYLQEIGKAIKETESYQVKLEQLICFLEFSKQRKKLDNSKNYKNSTNDEAHKKAYEILSSFAENEPEYHKAWTKHSRKIVKLQNSLDKIMSTDSESLAIAYRYCNATTDIGAMISRAAALLHQRFVAAMDNRDGSMYVVPEKGSEEYKKRVRIIDENLEEQAEDENENCTICLTPLITTSKNVSTDDNDLEFTRICSLKRCSHKFHYECIQQWLIQRPNCPVCRKNLRQTNCRNNCRNTSLSSTATQTVRQTSNSRLQRISTGTQQFTNNRVRISGSYPHIQNENSNIQTTNTGRLIENHQNNMASLGRQIRSQIEMDPRVSTGEIPASDDLVIIENHMDRLIRGNNQEELFERRIDIGRRNGVI